MVKGLVDIYVEDEVVMGAVNEDAGAVNEDFGAVNGDVGEERELDMDDGFEEPVATELRAARRPKKLRRREHDEAPTPTKLKRANTNYVCGFCHKKGHNSRKCPDKPAVDTSTQEDQESGPTNVAPSAAPTNVAPSAAPTNAAPSAGHGGSVLAATNLQTSADNANLVVAAQRPKLALKRKTVTTAQKKNKKICSTSSQEVRIQPQRNSQSNHGDVISTTQDAPSGSNYDGGTKLKLFSLTTQNTITTPTLTTTALSTTSLTTTAFSTTSLISTLLLSLVINRSIRVPRVLSDTERWFPFLVDQTGGISMYESGDIVKYLFEQYGEDDDIDIYQSLVLRVAPYCMALMKRTFDFISLDNQLLRNTVFTGWMPTILRARDPPPCTAWWFESLDGALRKGGDEGGGGAWNSDVGGDCLRG
ncbi:Zinc finger, CCHC-type superfamily [Sesbania bispinosa]|nr:Zinc finger, CCHC-type superfamily [Sesbania bispinosa]